MDENNNEVLEALDGLSERVLQLETSVSGVEEDLSILGADVMDALTPEPVDPNAPPPVTNEMILEALTPVDGSPTLQSLSDDVALLQTAVDSLGVEVASISQSIYSGTISSTYVDVFDRFSRKIGIFDDYLLYRSGQYSYTFIYGDLNFSNNRFTGTNLDVITISSQTGVQGYVYSVSSGERLDLAVGSQLVYSNLGSYPSLSRDESLFPLAFIFILVIALIACFIRPWFAWTYRSSCISGSKEVSKDVATV